MKNEHLNKATGWHFNKKGHSVSDMKVSILEKVFSTDEALRLEREKTKWGTCNLAFLF